MLVQLLSDVGLGLLTLQWVILVQHFRFGLKDILDFMLLRLCRHWLVNYLLSLWWSLKEVKEHASVGFTVSLRLRLRHLGHGRTLLVFWLGYPGNCW
jgi:hypothetical protein